MNRLGITFKRILTGVLASAMILTATPSYAFADEFTDEPVIETQQVEEPDAGEKKVEETDKDTASQNKSAEIVQEAAQDGEDSLLSEASEDALEAEEGAEDSLMGEGYTIEAATGGPWEGFGDKTAADLQDGIAFEGDSITGTLKTVTGWTQFGTDLSSGHYIALHVDDPAAVKIEAGIGEDGVWRMNDLTEDEEKIILLRVMNKDIQTIKVRFTYQRGSVEKVFDLSKLTLEGFGIDAENFPTETDLLGKKYDDLVDYIIIDTTSTIKGSLNYVTGYKGFSGNTDEQHGHYLPLYVPGAKGFEGQVSIISDSGKEWQVDTADGLIVLIVDDNVDLSNKKISLVKKYSDGSEETRLYSLSGLLLYHPSAMFEVTNPEDTSFGEAFGNAKPSDLQGTLTITDPVYDTDNEIWKDGEITGTLKQYTWSKGYGAPLDKGHYISIKVNAPGADKVTAEVTNGENLPADLTGDPDPRAILRIKNKDTQKLVVKATYDKDKETEYTEERTYDLSGLELESFEIKPFDDSSADLWGKKYTDLQEGVTTADSKLGGTLKYIYDYSSAFGEGMNRGHYIALSVPSAVEFSGGKVNIISNSGKTYTVDPADGGIVLYVGDDESLSGKKITLQKIYPGEAVEERYYALDDLELKKREDVVVVEGAAQSDMFFPTEPYEMATSALQNDNILVTEPGEGETEGAITGTLKTVTGWTAYGATMKDGHFLALKITAPGAKKIEAGVDPSDTGKLSTLDEDGLIAIRIKNKDTQKVKVRITYYDETPVERTYDISGLELDGFSVTASAADIGTSTDLLGKTVGDLQENVVIEDGTLKGTLKYVEGYTQFGGPDEQNGNFIALKVPGAITSDADTFIKSSSGKDWQVDPSDGLIILSVPDVDLSDKKISLVKKYTGGAEETREYSLSGLTLVKPTDLLEVVAPADDFVFFPSTPYEKVTSDLQSGVAVDPDANTITGTLKKVEGWTAYGANMNSGHFLAFKVNAPGATKVEAGVLPSDIGKLVELDADRTIAIRIRNKDTQKVHVKVYYGDDSQPVEKVFDISGLTLEGFAADTSISTAVDLFGKHVTDLHDGVSVVGSTISGTLKYVDDYSSAFGAGMDEGHYLVLHVAGANDKTVAVVSGSGTEYPVDPADGLIVLYVADVDLSNAKLKLQKTYVSGATEEREYSLAGLVLQEEPEFDAKYVVSIKDITPGATSNLFKVGEADVSRTIEATVTNANDGTPVKGAKVTWKSNNVALATVSGKDYTDNKGIATATLTVHTSTATDTGIAVLTVEAGYDNVSYGKESARFEAYKQATPSKTISLKVPDDAEATLENEFILPAGSEYSTEWKLIDGDKASFDVDPLFGIVYASAEGNAKFVQDVFDSEHNKVLGTAAGSEYDVSATKALSKIRLVSDVDEFFANGKEVENALHIEFEPEGYELGTGESIVWNITNPAVVGITPAGDSKSVAITGKSKGAATITAQVKKGTEVLAKANYIVRVKATIPGITIKKIGADEKSTLEYVKKGDSIKFFAEIPAGDETADYNVKWASDDANIAKVDASGVVTGNKVGSTTIKAAVADGTEAEVRIIVYDNISALTTNVSNLNLAVGKSTTVSVVGTPADADFVVKWTSSNEDIATVTAEKDNKATITAVKKGSAKITATDFETGLTAVINVNVDGKDVELKSITATSTDITLYETQTATLGYTTKPANFTNTVFEWTSSKPSVAKVDQRGVVTAVGAGTATITLQAKDIAGTPLEGKSVEYNVWVKELVVESMVVDPKTLTLQAPVKGIKAGESAKLVARTYPEFIDAKVNWESDALGVATVSADGVVQAVGAGNATIKASVVGTAIDKTVKVTVTESVGDDDIATGRYNEDGPWIGYVDDYTYTGTAIKPEPAVYYGSVRLTPGVDFTYAYANNVNAARTKTAPQPTVTVKMKGNFAGTATATFAIDPVDLSNGGDVTINNVSAVAKVNKKTGAYAEQLLKPTIMYKGKVLKENKDYELFYMSDEFGAYEIPGNWPITINGLGNFRGEGDADEILVNPAEAISIAKATITGIDKTYEYGYGAEVGPDLDAVVVKVVDKRVPYTLEKDVDYDVTICDNIEIGTATVTYTGKGKFYGTKKVTFKIVPHVENLSTPTAQAQLKVIVDGVETPDVAEIPFAKGGTKPSTVEVWFNTVPLNPGVDFTWTSTKLDKNNKGTVSITGKGKFFKGTAKNFATFKAVKKDMSNVTVALDDFVYSNKAYAYEKNKITVYDVDGKALKYDKNGKGDYTLAFDAESSTPAVGSYITVTIFGTGMYEGAIQDSFRIIDKNLRLSTAKYSFMKDGEEVAANKFAIKYAGTPVTIDEDEIVLRVKKKVGRTYNWVVIDPSEYEIVTFQNNNKVGTATVVVRGIGEYGGLLNVKVKIKK